MIALSAAHLDIECERAVETEAVVEEMADETAVSKSL